MTELERAHSGMRVDAFLLFFFIFFFILRVHFLLFEEETVLGNRDKHSSEAAF